MFGVALVQTGHGLLAPHFGLWKVGDGSRRKYDTMLEMPDAKEDLKRSDASSCMRHTGAIPSEVSEAA